MPAIKLPTKKKELKKVTKKRLKELVDEKIKEFSGIIDEEDALKLVEKDGYNISHYNDAVDFAILNIYKTTESLLKQLKEYGGF